MSSFSVGDQVERVVGDRWLGTVVAVFHTIADRERVVVERQTPKVVGILHIYSPEQLKSYRRGCRSYVVETHYAQNFGITNMTDEELAKTIGRLVAELNADIERYVVALLDDCTKKLNQGLVRSPTMWAKCEDCGKITPAMLYRVGVTVVGHCVHCGRGHQCSIDGLSTDEEIESGSSGVVEE